jgi:hypothetical protein
MSYLSLEDFGKDPLPVDAGGVFFSQKQIDYVREHALLDYAAIYWPDHFRDSQNRQLELFELTRRICQFRSDRFLIWFKLFWRNNRGSRHSYDPFPKDFTSLMIASWLGQEVVVKRILEEEGDLNAKSAEYGTALDVAALRGHASIARMLVERNVVAYIYGKEVNILNTKRSELEGEEEELRERLRQELVVEEELLLERLQREEKRELVLRLLVLRRERFLLVRRRVFQRREVIDFLKPLCIQDVHYPGTVPLRPGHDRLVLR